VQVTEDLHNLATSEAGNMLMIVKAGEDVQEDKAAGSEAAAPEADTGIPDSPHSEIVIVVESDSTQSPSSQSTSSLSSSEFDDMPLGKLYPSIPKGPSSSTKTHKKPADNITHEPIR
jgi:formylmethanofuran dehydrogenase subunit D